MSPSAARALVVLGTVGAVAVIGVATYVTYPRSQPIPTPSATADAAPAASSGPRVNAVEPTDLLVRAKARALAWHDDAMLIAIVAGPVVAGRVPLGAEGKVEVVYAQPAGPLLPGSRAESPRLRITFEGERMDVVETPEGPPARTVAEPGCTLNQAWRTVVASGVPSSESLSFTYERSDKHDREVWRTGDGSDPKLSRTLDGRRCTVLIR